MTIEAVNVPIPSDVLDKLNPYKADLEILSVEEIDPFHNSLHVQQLKQFAYWIKPAFDVNSVDNKRLNRGIEIHDQGYAFVKRGLLTPDQHHFGSAFIALELDKDPELAWGVFSHVEDVLEYDGNPWIRILRDVDRIDRLGPGMEYLWKPTTWDIGILN